MIYDLVHIFKGHEQTSEVNLDELAIIMIDMTPYFLNHINPKKRESLIHAQKKIIEVSAKKNIPILQVEMNKYGIGNEAKTIPELEAIAKTAPRYAKFNKTAESALQEPAIREQLEMWTSNYHLLMGINTYCILATAKDSRKETYQVITAPELIASPQNDQKAWKEHTNWLSNNAVYLDSYVKMLTAMRRK